MIGKFKGVKLSFKHCYVLEIQFLGIKLLNILWSHQMYYFNNYIKIEYEIFKKIGSRKLLSL